MANPVTRRLSQANTAFFHFCLRGLPLRLKWLVRPNRNPGSVCGCGATQSRVGAVIYGHGRIRAASLDWLVRTTNSQSVCCICRTTSLRAVEFQRLHAVSEPSRALFALAKLSAIRSVLNQNYSQKPTAKRCLRNCVAQNRPPFACVEMIDRYNAGLEQEALDSSLTSVFSQQQRKPFVLSPVSLSSSPDPTALGFGPAQAMLFRSRPRRTEICESIYARVSTRDQSCGLQARSAAYCAARGFGLSANTLTWAIGREGLTPRA